MLVQAFLDAPVFQTRWRWNTTIALAVPRRRGGRKLAAQIQRMLADDLMAAVFPDAAACLENIAGDREIPDHPLVTQAVRDCLQEAMDHDGLASVLERIHAGGLTLVARDTPEPSCFAHEILNANPYTFLDDAPLEERRTHAVQSRRAATRRARRISVRWIPPPSNAWLPKARPEPRDADELHDALLTAGFLPANAVSSIDPGLVDVLLATGRVTQAMLPATSRTEEQHIWVAAERLPELRAIHPAVRLDPDVEPPLPRSARAWTRDDAIVEVLRGQLAILGPTTAEALAGPWRLPSTTRMRRSSRSNRPGWSCAGDFLQPHRILLVRWNGATAASSRGFIAIRCTGYAPRSSR